MGFIFPSILLDALAIISITVIILCLYIKFRIFGYWKRHGIKYLEPSFPFGHLTATFMQKMSVGETMQQLYNRSSEPFIGIYCVTRPTLLLRDPALIRTIFIKDFQSFKDRGVYIDEVHDPLSGHLFSLSGEKWKNLRIKLSPVFTSGKIKAMFSTLMSCGATLQQFMQQAAENQETVEVREIAARFTTDVIASVAFGVDINSIENPDTSFRRYGRKVYQSEIIN